LSKLASIHSVGSSTLQLATR